MSSFVSAGRTGVTFGARLRGPTRTVTSTAVGRGVFADVVSRVDGQLLASTVSSGVGQVAWTVHGGELLADDLIAAGATVVTVTVHGSYMVRATAAGTAAVLFRLAADVPPAFDLIGIGFDMSGQLANGGDDQAADQLDADDLDPIYVAGAS